jgi:excisionase family DNA binding protein
VTRTALASPPVDGERPAADAGPLLTPPQVAERLAVSVSMVRKLTREGRLRALYIGRCLRFEAAAVEQLIAGAASAETRR